MRFTLPHIREPFTQITSDGDSSLADFITYSGGDEVLKSPLLSRWYCQNAAMGPSVRERFGDLYELISTKVIPIPIGLDLHKMRDGLNGITALRLFRETQSADYGPRSKKILVDCCLNQTSKDRVALCKELRRSDHFEFMERRVLRGDLWKLYRRYDAILSLPGYGLDCHRTWEALYLGAKVIVQQVGLAGLYRGLPVAEFQDVDQLLSEELIYKVRQMDILRGQPAEFD